MVIWRRSTCLWVGFSSRTRKMTLEHRLLHRTRNKMNIWNCIVLRPNALNSSLFTFKMLYKQRLGREWVFVLGYFGVGGHTANDSYPLLKNPWRHLCIYITPLCAELRYIRRMRKTLYHLQEFKLFSHLQRNKLRYNIALICVCANNELFLNYFI